MNELSHPCKQTCSGWLQGYEEGKNSMTREVDKIEKAANDVTELLIKLEDALETLFVSKTFSYNKTLLAERTLLEKVRTINTHKDDVLFTFRILKSKLIQYKEE